MSNGFEIINEGIFCCRFLPYPRFPLPDDKSAYIVCVYNKPRIQNCGYDSYFDEQTLSCVYADHQVGGGIGHF